MMDKILLISIICMLLVIAFGVGIVNEKVSDIKDCACEERE